MKISMAKIDSFAGGQQKGEGRQQDSNVWHKLWQQYQEKLELKLMPELGAPADLRRNPFSNIKMRGDSNDADRLNPARRQSRCE